jgi:hypothetical protein
MLTPITIQYRGVPKTQGGLAPISTQVDCEAFWSDISEDSIKNPGLFGLGISVKVQTLLADIQMPQPGRDTILCDGKQYLIMTVSQVTSESDLGLDGTYKMLLKSLETR